MQNRRVKLLDWGITDYQEALQKQSLLFEKLKQIKIENKYTDTPKITENYFIFTEHPHVYTLGKSGKEEHLLIDDRQRQEKKVQFIKTNRGGDITYHGPGQIVGYPIIDLDNFDLEIMSYMRKLEEVIIQVLKYYNIQGERSEGETGVWLDVNKPGVRKICAMGVKTSRWITMHGFALNVYTDLSYFDYIVPCGIKDKGVTSIRREIGKDVDIQLLKNRIIAEFEREFGAEFMKE